MKLKLTWLLTLFMAFVMQFSFAQEKTVTGTVTTASDGLPLPGANVIVKGTSRGAQTDFDGKYTIKANTGDVLVVSYVGMTPSEITVGTASVYDVALEEGNALDEVIVVAYGKKINKAKSNSSSVQIANDFIENRPNVNVLNSLQGQVAGVNIASASGQPGTNKNDVVIRGVGSVSGSTEPLYVIDGVPLTQAFFRNLNQNEIESVTTLKDAAATAIYGNRGSNGVIVITTKSGRFGENFSIGYSSSYGYTDFIEDDYNLGSAIDHLRLQQKGFSEGVGVLASSLGVSGTYFPGIPANDPRQVTVDPNNLDDFDTDVDWRDVFYRTGQTQSHDLSVSVGGERYSNFTNFGYFEQDGIVPNSNFKRFTLRNNFSGKSLNDKFSYSVRLFSAFSRRDQFEQETRGGINNNVLQNPLTGYLASSRFLPLDLYENGAQLLADYGNPSLSLVPYMLVDLFQENSQNNNFQEFKTILNFEASYKITKDITFGIITAGDFADERELFYVGPNSYLSSVRASGAGQSFHGLEDITNTREFTFNHINRLTYNKIFDDKHTIDLSLYTDYQKAHRRTSFQRQVGLNALDWSPGAGTGYLPFSPGVSPNSYAPSVNAFDRDAGLFSYFATLDYDFNSKYGFYASIRRDANYRFVDDNQWGTFWSVAGRWNLDKENFLANSSIVDELKLRASYGATGNANPFPRGTDSATSEIFGGAQLTRDLLTTGTGINNTSSFAVSSFGNPDAVWETTFQFDVGIDFALFNSRFRGSLDYYNRLTTDLYQPALPVSIISGTSSVFSNDGSLRNQGVEFQGEVDVFREGKFKLSAFANVAYNKDSFGGLGAADSDRDGSLRVGNGIIRNVGGQVSEYFLVPYAGVNPANGNLLFVDINGNLTENPTDSDRRATGKSLRPTYQGGFGFNMQYEGFFLNSLFTYSYDFWRTDSNYSFAMDFRNAGDFPVSNNLFNAWTPTNRVTDVPAANASNIDAGNNLSDRFLTDASFLRLRNLTFGYNFPSKFLDGIFINQLSFRVTAENYFTWTKWRGLDPERIIGSEASGFFPNPKILTFGLDVKF